MTDDLVTRAKTLSAMINLGERIACGQDTAMIDELSARIEQEAATIARLTGERDAMFRRAHLAEEWRDHDKERAEAAEAKVAALVEALLFYAASNNDHGIIARAAIAAAKGE